MQVSFDGGDTWDLSEMKHLPDSPSGYVLFFFINLKIPYFQ